MALPLPKVVSDVGPGGGIVTAMGGMNALTHSNLENTKAAIVNKYLPAGEESKIRHTLSPLSMYGTDAGNLAYLSQAKDNPSGSQPVQIPQQQNQSPLNALLQFMGMNHKNNPQPNAMQQSNMQKASNMAQAPTSDNTTELAGGPGSSVYGAPTPVTAPEPGAAPSAPSAPSAPGEPVSLAQYQAMDVYDKARFQATDQLGYASLKGQIDAKNAGLSTASNNEQGQLNEQQTVAQNFADTAPKVEANIDRLSKAYTKVSSWQKGPLGSLVPVWANSGDRDSALSAQSNLVSLLAPMQNGGHLAVKNFDIAGTLKPNIALTKEGFKEVTEYSKGLVQRQKEFLPMFNKLKDAGVPSSKIAWAYSQYNDNHPYYDVDKNKAINSGKYKEYLTPEAISTLSGGNEYNPDDIYGKKAKLTQSNQDENSENSSQKVLTWNAKTRRAE